MLRLEILFWSEESCAGESAQAVVRHSDPGIVKRDSRIANLAKFAIRVGAHNDFARVKSVSNRGISPLEMRSCGQPLRASGIESLVDDSSVYHFFFSSLLLF